jgi:hypothetical protein
MPRGGRSAVMAGARVGMADSGRPEEITLDVQAS